MPRWLAEALRRPFRPLATAALVALAPKCMVCVLAYAGIGALLGIRSPEICGAASGPRTPWETLPTAIGVALGIIAVFAVVRSRRSSSRGRRTCP
jgi:hypothetical protein